MAAGADDVALELRRLREENAALKKAAAAAAAAPTTKQEDDVWQALRDDDWTRRQASLEQWMDGPEGAPVGWGVGPALSEASKEGVRKAVAQLHENGYAIVPALLDDAAVERVTAGMAPVWEATSKMFREDTPLPPGTEPHHEDIGKRPQTRHLQNVLAKTRAADEVATSPVLRAIICGTLTPDFIMNAGVVGMNPDPGCGRQGLHRDDGFFPLPRPRMPVVVTAAVLLDDFSPETGSTALVKGAHLWEDGRAPQREEIVQHSGAAGTAVIWDGAVLHGGGANLTTDGQRRTVTINYTRGWLRTQFNQVRKRSLFPTFYTKMIILPRQARDKHREHSKKSTEFLQYVSIPREIVLGLPPELQTDIGYHHSKSVEGWLQGGLGGADTQDALTYIQRMGKYGGEGAQRGLGRETVLGSKL